MIPDTTPPHTNSRPNSTHGEAGTPNSTTAHEPRRCIRSAAIGKTWKASRSPAPQHDQAKYTAVRVAAAIRTLNPIRTPGQRHCHQGRLEQAERRHSRRSAVPAQTSSATRAALPPKLSATAGSGSGSAATAMTRRWR
jgi:hypothetical protein